MTLIEKVADAIVIASNKELSPNEIARAAIEAMRTPTEGMELEGLAVVCKAPVSEAALPREVWRAMIAAALEDQP